MLSVSLGDFSRILTEFFMQSSLLSILILALALSVAPAGVKISEFMASNGGVLNDQDGDSSDWIELHNDGVSTVNLAGWSLTDDSSDLTKWTFPSVDIPAGGYLVVFASAKDLKGSELHTNFSLKKNGEYLALIQPGQVIEQEFSPAYPAQVQNISYGLSAGAVNNTVIQMGAAGQAGVPTDELDFSSHFSGWNSELGASFATSSWRNISSGVGFERNSGYGSWLGSGGDFEAEMYDRNSSVFLRIPFHLSDPASISAMTLRMRWDAGFVAYLNGVKVASDRDPASLVWNSSATSDRPDGQNDDWESFIIDLDRLSLQSGNNLLAIHGLNDRVGSSDMLCLPELDVMTPAESAESLYFTSPTPGQVNASGSTDLAPSISEVTDAVAVLPQGGAGSSPIRVTARVAKTMHDVQSVQLFYRKMFDSESALTMVDNGADGDLVSGDGIFTALVPTTSMAAGEMIRWRVVATDSANNSAKSPAYIDPNDSDQYYGTIANDPSLATSQLPVLHWFVENVSSADTRGGTRASCYFLGRFYDNVQVDLHGQTSAGFPKKSYDFDFNQGNRFVWKEGEIKVKDFNLLTNWADKSKMRNALSNEVINQSGMVSHYDQQVRVQQNAAFFSVADMVEDGDDRFLERAGLDPDGALYKMYNTLNSVGGGSKQTRKEENKSDLQALIDGLDPTQPLDDIRRYAYDNVDLPRTISYLAARALIHDDDHQHKNYYVYRDTSDTGEWSPLVWDVDLSWGRNWAGSYFLDEMFYQNSLIQRHDGQGKGENRLYELVFDSPELRKMYLRRLRTLMDTILQAPDTPSSELILERRIDEYKDLIDPVDVISDADLDYAKWGSWGNQNRMRAAADRIKNEHLPNRRDFLFNQNPVLQGTPIPLVQTLLPSVTIEDLDYNPSSGLQAEEYFILKNRELESIDVSGWTISGAVEMTLKPGTVIPAGGGDSDSDFIGLLHIAKDVTAFRARSSGPSGGSYRFIQGGYDGQLSARGETIELRDAAGNLIDRKSFTGIPTATQEALRVSEINYHPSAPTLAELADLPGVTASDFEWLELVNIGPTLLDLDGASFTDGIEFTFTGGETLAPGARMILVKNRDAFALRYGSLSNVVGPYSGQLSNSGETLQLKDVSGESILQFSWNDKWYPPSDGQGRSLVIRDPDTAFSDFDEPQSWAISSIVDGSPGAEDPAYYLHFEAWRYEQFSKLERADVLVGMAASDPDGDGRSNWTEYCFGSDPHLSDHMEVRPKVASSGGQNYMALEFIARRNAFDISWSLQSCSDLLSWKPEGSVIDGPSQAIGASLERVTLRSNTTYGSGGKKFFRVQGVQN